jgi:glycosyltransferase involved in cell wall biosynthesis
VTIAITVDPEIPVPPLYYGGIERIVDLLVRGLVDRGHKVVLFAHPESSVPCHLEPYPSTRSRGPADLLRNALHVCGRILDCKPDVVHSFGRLAYLTPMLRRAVPKVMTYQRIITPRSVQIGEALAGQSLHFTACSQNLMKAYAGKSNWHVVYNGVSASAYVPSYIVPSDAPLAFLGRVEEIKGPHLAIQAAKQSGRRLIIAGNVPDGPKHKEFFDAFIRPHVDGKNIEYVGPVNDSEKNGILAGAAALLMPILWDEPFGIVMAEALACGTPVIGFGRGAVPEIVRDGIDGFVCDSAESMATAIARLSQLDRRECRRIFETKFSDTVMLDAYSAVYAKC